MRLTQTQILAVILILFFVWVLIGWNCQENFGQINNYSYLPTNRTYYNNYKKLPQTSTSLETLQNKYNKKIQAEQILKQKQSVGPVPHNTHSGQTQQVAAPENINQVGALLHEVLAQEISLMQPLNQIRDQMSREMEYYSMQLPQQLSQGMMMQNIGQMPDIGQGINSPLEEKLNEEVVLQELSTTNETNAEYEMKPEIEHETQHEMRQEIEHEMRPELEYEMEQINTEGPIVIKVQKPAEYGIPLSLLLTVLLIAFMYYTKPQY